MIYFRHHSRLLTFRRPQGAAPCGSSVHIEAECGDPNARVQLRLYHQNGSESFFDMQVSGGRATADLPMPEAPGLVWYYFIIRLQDGQTLYYGADSGEGALRQNEPRAYQITVYDGAFETPQSWREGIVYRFSPTGSGAAAGRTFAPARDTMWKKAGSCVCTTAGARM